MKASRMSRIGFLIGVIALPLSSCISSEREARNPTADPAAGSNEPGTPAPVSPEFSLQNAKLGAMGWTDENNQPAAVEIHAVVPDGYVAECRAGHESVVDSLAWGPCGSVSGSTIRYALSPTAGKGNGAYRFDARLQKDGADVTVLTRSIYMHDSMNGVARCAMAPTDAELIAKAREFLPAASTFGAGTSFKAPFIHIEFSDGIEEDPASLRRRFRLSEDRKFLVITRDLGSRKNAGSCESGLTIRSRKTTVAQDSSKHSGFKRDSYSCGVVVLNSIGDGACLDVSGTNVTFTHALMYTRRRFEHMFSSKSRQPVSEEDAIYRKRLYIPD